MKHKSLFAFHIFRSRYFRLFLFFQLVFILTHPIHSLRAQPSWNIEKNFCYGGSKAEAGVSSIILKDGSYILLGSSGSTDGNLTYNHGSEDVWVAKIGTNNKIIWQRSYGSSGQDYPMGIIATQDGGYAFIAYVVGWAYDTLGSYGDVAGLGPWPSCWLVKIDSVGNILWSHCFGGGEEPTDNAYPWSLIEQEDGSIVVCGWEQTTGEGFNNHGNCDAYVVKFRSDGAMKWQTCLGGDAYDEARVVLPGPNNTLWVLCNAESINTGDVVGHHIADSAYSDNNSDVWVVQLDSNSHIIKSRCIGGTWADNVNSGCLSPDGGILFVGNTESTDYDLANTPITGKFWVVKIDTSFNIEWQHIYGGLPDLNGYSQSITSFADGSFAVVGSTNAVTGDVKGAHISTLLKNGMDSTRDIWVFGCDPKGNLEWQRCLGGRSDEAAASITVMPDSSLLVTGYALQADGDVSKVIGGGDVWLVWLVPGTLGVDNGGAHPLSQQWQYQPFFIMPQPANDVVHLQLYESQTAKSVDFYDVLGRRYVVPYVQNSTNELTADIRSLPSGVYIARLTYSYNTFVGTYSEPIVVGH